MSDKEKLKLENTRLGDYPRYIYVGIDDSDKTKENDRCLCSFDIGKTPISNS